MSRPIATEDRLSLGPLARFLREPLDGAHLPGLTAAMVGPLAAAYAISPSAARMRAERAKREGLSIWQADRWAAALGVHPSAIWPEWWDLPTR